MCGTPSSLVAMSGRRENRTRHTPTRRPGAGISQHRWLRVRARGGRRGTPWAAQPAWARTTSGSRSPCARIDSRSSRSASAPSPTWCAGRRRPADDRAGRQDDGLVLSAPSIAPGRGAGARSPGRWGAAADGVAPAPQVPSAASQERRPLPRGHASAPSAMIAMPALWERDSASSFSVARPPRTTCRLSTLKVWRTARGGI